MKRFSRFLTALISGTVSLTMLSGNSWTFAETINDYNEGVISENSDYDLGLNSELVYGEGTGEFLEETTGSNDTEDISITTTSTAPITSVPETYTTADVTQPLTTSSETVIENVPKTTTAAPVVIVTTTTTTTKAPAMSTMLITHTTAANANKPSFKVFDIYEAHVKYMFELTSTTAATTTRTVKTTTAKPATTPPLATQVNVEKGIKGIDVSEWQGSVNWNSVKSAGVKFAMIRAGYGRYTNQKDLMFDTNMKGTAGAGLSRGIYWYSYATTADDALREAEACYQIIKNYKFEYPIYYDIEESSQQGLSTATVSAIADTFCSYLQSKGYYVGIYSYASFINTKFYDNILKKYDVWVAHFDVNSPAVSASYGMWQYTDHGSVNGISGNVDFDYAYKDYPYIIAKNHKNGY